MAINNKGSSTLATFIEIKLLITKLILCATYCKIKSRPTSMILKKKIILS